MDGRAPAVDEDALMRRLQGDTDLLKDVVRIFLEDLPTQLETLCTAIEAGEDKEIYAAAHRLKGALSNMSAQHSLGIVVALESAAEENAKSLYPTLIHSVDSLKSKLERMVEERTRAAAS